MNAVLLSPVYLRSRILVVLKKGPDVGNKLLKMMTIHLQLLGKSILGKIIYRRKNKFTHTLCRN